MPSELRKSQPPKRKLVPSNVDGLNVIVPGLGAFALQGVGSTARSYGYHASFQPDGADEPVRGYIPLRCRIDDDMKLVWYVRDGNGSYGTNPDLFPREALDRMLTILGELPERDPVGVVFNVLDEIRAEKRTYDLEVERLQGRTKSPKLDAAAELARLEAYRSLKANRLERLASIETDIKRWCNTAGTKSLPLSELLPAAAELQGEATPGLR